MMLYAQAGRGEPIGQATQTDGGWLAQPFGADALGTYPTQEDAEIALVQAYGAITFWRELAGPFQIR